MKLSECVKLINKEIKMYQLSKINFPGFLLLNILVFSSVVEARDCNKGSPNFTVGEDKYYDLGLYKKLTNKEKKAISSYFDKISGDWDGSLVHMECKGSIKSPQRVIKETKVTSDIRNNGNSVLTVSYDANYLESRTSTRHKIKTLGNKNIYVLNFSDDNNLSFSEKYRRGNGSGGAFLVENIYDIQMGKHSLNIDLTVYHNGFFAWSDALKLK